MTTTQTQSSPIADGLAEVHATCGSLPWPVKTIAVIAAFMIFPPLGLAALIYLVWASRGRSGRQYRARRTGARSERCAGRRGSPRTGNSAFDAHLAGQRRKIEEDRKAFAEFAEQQRQAEDRKAFNEFVSARIAGANSSDEAKTADPDI